MSVELRRVGIRLYVGWGVPHDYLWFSSTETPRFSTTLPVLHNYALTFSLSQRSWAAYTGTRPDYERDLAACDYYALCAAWLGAERVRLTQNAIDDLTQRTDTGGGRNTPSLGYRVCLLPRFLPEDGFRVFVFAFAEAGPPPVVTRLGKKGCCIRWRWSEIELAVMRVRTDAWSPTHPLNALDLQTTPEVYDPVVMPPSLVYRYAVLRDEPVVDFGRDRIHVPARALRRVGLA
jgi:CRISPR type I-D-associated protein Csc1